MKKQLFFLVILVWLVLPISLFSAHRKSDSALYNAVAKNNTARAVELIKNASIQKLKEYFRYYSTSSFCDTTGSHIVENDNVQVAEALFSVKPQTQDDVDYKFETIRKLVNAAFQQGKIGIAEKFFVTDGIDNKFKRNVLFGYNDSNSPIHLAFEYCRPAILKLFFDAQLGANGEESIANKMKILQHKDSKKKEPLDYIMSKKYYNSNDKPTEKMYKELLTVFFSASLGENPKQNGKNKVALLTINGNNGSQVVYEAFSGQDTTFLQAFFAANFGTIKGDEDDSAHKMSILKGHYDGGVVTPLYQAFFHGNDQAVLALLNSGLGSDNIVELFNHPNDAKEYNDKSSRLPLQGASDGGYPNVLTRLASHQVFKNFIGQNDELRTTINAIPSLVAAFNAPIIPDDAGALVGQGPHKIEQGQGISDTDLNCGVNDIDMSDGQSRHDGNKEKLLTVRNVFIAGSLGAGISLFATAYLMRKRIKRKLQEWNLLEKARDDYEDYQELFVNDLNSKAVDDVFHD